jgi:antitoxin component YwqK of YwqJK toxin-antitoxin module
MKQDKTPRNKQGQQHGCWEIYDSNGQLHYKGNYINGKPHGYWERCWSNGQLCYKGNCINGIKDGLWIENNYRKIKFYL